MKAVQIQSYGGIEVFSFQDTPIPVPGENDALIQVAAASINPADVAYRAGYMASYTTLTFPAILGLDVAGTVAAVGSAVTNLKVGEPVYARTDLSRLGGYAEYTLVTAAEVVRKPESLDFVQAAAIPHAAVTSWRALFDTAALQAGQTILIHGAAGGVGSIAVQLAKNRGAYVIGTSSASNLEFLKDLGADEAFDYTASPFEKKYKGLDVVLDTIGGDTLARSYQMVRPGGILMSILEPPSAETAAPYHIRVAFPGGYPPVAPVLNEINNLIEAGKVRPVVSKVIPLSEIRHAHELIATRHTRGKIVMQV